MFIKFQYYYTDLYIEQVPALGQKLYLIAYEKQ